jgi:asparagine synthase (glutamine-hydrolysing)
MCRIAGIISNNLTPGEIREKVNKMCDVLEHGGPDDKGIFSDDKVNLVFGHRRLSIIDLSPNGHQPMADVQQKAWITFNGEIYNYLDLKDQLKSLGARFHSNTDTEVIIAAYSYWGMAAFSKLRGIFAFALYDTEKALTYLVRDSSGVKPLYYHIKNSQLSFSSEVKALKEAQIASETDANWQIRFLAYGHIPEPYTTLKDVYSLPKGEFLCWHHHKNTYEIHSYHVINNKARITDMNEAREAIKAALTLAVNRQLVADAPIGVFLSGGIDSSLITLLANEQKKAQLKTISIYFDEKAYDERMYQSEILKEIEGDKFGHLVQEQDFEEFLPQIMADMDMPTTDGINSWFISKYAHQDGLRAVLSGIGADELFGGYPSFNRIKHLKSLRRFPASLYSIAKHLISDPYKKVSYLTYRHPIADYLLLRGLFAPEDIAQLLGTDLHQVENVLFSNRQLSYVRKYNEEDAAFFETNLYMQNQLLRDTDVMGMCHGLEIRVPFLDEDFKRLTENIAPEIRFNRKQPKKLLIDSFEDILPRKIWDRPKMGFTFPLQEWLRNNEEINNAGLYSGKKARSVMKTFKSNAVHWSKAFALYQIRMHA